MTEPSELWAALVPFLEELEEMHVSYFIGGSVASSFTGLARATQDADVVADLRLAHAPPLCAALRDRYYLSEDTVLRAIKSRGSFNCIHLDTAFKIDVFTSASTAYARQCMARRVRLDVPEAERSLDFCAPEDIVLRKLEWYEMGRRVSERQWNDVRGVLRLQAGRLDLDYLRRWAKDLGLTELLERAFDDAREPKA